MFPQTADLRQICVFLRGRILKYAVEQDEFAVIVSADDGDSTFDLIEIRRTDREQDWLPLLRHVFNKRQVREVRRGDLIDLHHFRKIVCRIEIERCGAKLDTCLRCKMTEFTILIRTKGVEFLEQLILRCSRLLARIPVGGRVF